MARGSRSPKGKTTEAPLVGSPEGKGGGNKVSRPAGYGGRTTTSGRAGLSDAALGANNRGSGGKGAPGTGGGGSGGSAASGASAGGGYYADSGLVATTTYAGEPAPAPAPAANSPQSVIDSITGPTMATVPILTAPATTTAPKAGLLATTTTPRVSSVSPRAAKYAGALRTGGVGVRTPTATPGVYRPGSVKAGPSERDAGPSGPLRTSTLINPTTRMANMTGNLGRTGPAQRAVARPPSMVGNLGRTGPAQRAVAKKPSLTGLTKTTIAKSTAKKPVAVRPVAIKRPASVTRSGPQR